MSTVGAEEGKRVRRISVRWLARKRVRAGMETHLGDNAVQERNPQRPYQSALSDAHSRERIQDAELEVHVAHLAQVDQLAAELVLLRIPDTSTRLSAIETWYLSNRRR